MRPPRSRRAAADVAPAFPVALVALLWLSAWPAPARAQDRDPDPAAETADAGPPRADVHWRVRKPDGTPWTNTRFSRTFATDSRGEVLQPGVQLPAYGPDIAPIPLEPSDGNEIHVLLEIGDSGGWALVNDQTEYQFSFRKPGFEKQLLLGFPTGIDFEGLSGMPALYARSLLATDKEPGQQHSRVQWQLAAGFQLPLVGRTYAGNYDGLNLAPPPGLAFNMEGVREVELSDWPRSALNGAQLCLAGNLRFALADTDAADAGRPLSAMLALKWIPTDGELERGAALGLDLSFTLPFDALRDRRGEDVDGILDAGVHVGGSAWFIGMRGWLSFGRSSGEDAFTRFRMRLEVAFAFLSFGYDMELRTHDAQRLGGEARYGLLISFGGLGHGISVLLDFRLGGDIGDAFRFGIGVPFV